MREITLLGIGSSLSDCPYDGEIWATSSYLSHPQARVDKIDKVFAFDFLRYVETELKIAREHNIPIVSTRDYATEPYPLSDIVGEFNLDPDFLLNTMSYMIALTIYQGYEKINLYGVDQGPEWEYLSTKPYITFWLGVATGRGIMFELSPSCLLKERFISVIKAKVKNVRRVSKDKMHLELLPLLK